MLLGWGYMTCSLDKAFVGQKGGGVLDGKGPHGRPQKRLDRRLEEVVKAVGGGFCRFQKPLELALAVRETVAGTLEQTGGAGAPPLPMHPWYGWPPTGWARTSTWTSTTMSLPLEAM